jgi:3'-phosphoadenosine 5'-phosphosulfate sulfotransferase (PAPS reductase)/FAD synthetase
MLNILSLGAGVQSSTMALMAAHGELPMPDCAIFADTQWEPKAIYKHLDWLEKQLPFPVHRVTAGSLRDGAISEAPAAYPRGER